MTLGEFCIEKQHLPGPLLPCKGILRLEWAVKGSVTAHNTVSPVLAKLSNHLSKYKLSRFFFSNDAVDKICTAT